MSFKERRQQRRERQQLEQQEINPYYRPAATADVADEAIAQLEQQVREWIEDGFQPNRHSFAVTRVPAYVEDSIIGPHAVRMHAFVIHWNGERNIVVEAQHGLTFDDYHAVGINP